MCGIAGRIRSDGGAVGADIVELAACMEHRGADSTGFAIYGPPYEHGYIVRLFLNNRRALEDAISGLDEVNRRFGTEYVEPPSPDATNQPHVLVRAVITEPEPLDAWVDAVEHRTDFEVQSVGRSLEVIKDVGNAREVDIKHGVSQMSGTHALSNMRLATESLVSPTASHPFWARPFPDVCIVHNGQITNYSSWRRRLERSGYTFASQNDSELIAVWNSVQMAAGTSLEDSLRQSLEQLDGVFTYLLATADSIGMAKDRWAIKPLIAVETATETTLATEEQALRSIYISETTVANYDAPSLIKTWPVGEHTEVVAA